jgi:soluble lytic murein transglycosylase
MMMLVTRSPLILTMAATAALGALAVAPAHATDAAGRWAQASKALSAQGGPATLSDKQRKLYADVLAAMRAKRWADADALLDSDKDGPLNAYLRAQFLLAPDSPRAELTDIVPLLESAPDLPQATRLATMAAKRGATTLPRLPAEQRLIWAGSAPRRVTERSVDDPAASTLGGKIRERIKADDPVGAELLLEEARPTLSPEGLTEWQQRVAWSYYIENDDANALRVAREAAQGSGRWAMRAAWVEGLAAWRTGEMRAADDAFARVGRTAEDPEMRAAGHYWSARTATKLREKKVAEQRFRAAMHDSETFYGMLAAEALDETSVVPRTQARADDNGLNRLPNIRAARAMIELGATDDADALVRHQARIGDPAQHSALAALAGAMGLPETQLYLAHNTPRGVRPDMMARYPAPQWQPSGGWQVDPALVFAHTLQESQFRRTVVSAAGAQGLMQVRPGTARDIARWRGDLAGNRDLKNPAVNMDFGQSYLQLLSGDTSTGGLLPKVIAAYNAGPTPVARWATEVRDNGDPLLYIESIPYWETRGYVGIVLRNYWMYEAQAGKPSESRKDLVAGRWPRFPGTIRSAGIAMTSVPTSLNAD